MKDIKQNKNIELLQDAKGNCGCYELGNYYYDNDGDPTHAINEKCYE